MPKLKQRDVEKIIARVQEHLTKKKFYAYKQEELEIFVEFLMVKAGMRDYVTIADSFRSHILKRLDGYVGQWGFEDA